MLSLRDCLDYCDLTDDEVTLIAEHEHVSDATAAHMACGLVQTPEGVVMLTNYMLDVIERADQDGDAEKAEYAREQCARFMADHPLPH